MLTLTLALSRVISRMGITRSPARASSMLFGARGHSVTPSRLATPFLSRRPTSVWAVGLVSSLPRSKWSRGYIKELSRAAGTFRSRAIARSRTFGNTLRRAAAGCRQSSMTTTLSDVRTSSLKPTKPSLPTLPSSVWNYSPQSRNATSGPGSATPTGTPSAATSPTAFSGIPAERPSSLMAPHSTVLRCATSPSASRRLSRATLPNASRESPTAISAPKHC
mmetsp:Transcript_4971/g.11208  ORF Transcript_4971/g.11208 Transcript_4971/m.11208 type:complete len:221 (-) Transcript_4971:201-863(-)